jgi:hypothetical protein
VERREHDRYPLWFPVQLDSEAVQEGMAVSHDTSRTGILLAVAAPLDVGTEVTLTFRVPPDSPDERRVKGRVVRVEPNSADPFGLWPHKMAIEFAEPEPELESILRDETGVPGVR